jgi:thyroid adenoma-associated protein
MTRIFGVKRSKDDLSRKNSMTSRVFFVRYPCLHRYLLEELAAAAKIVQSFVGAISPKVI